MIQSAKIKLHDLTKKPNTMLSHFLLLYPGQNITNYGTSFPVWREPNEPIFRHRWQQVLQRVPDLLPVDNWSRWTLSTRWRNVARNCGARDSSMLTRSLTADTVKPCIRSVRPRRKIKNLIQKWIIFNCQWDSDEMSNKMFSMSRSLNINEMKCNKKWEVIENVES
jgi:hypothetical protein